MDKKTKTVYTLAPPFPEPQWPQISSEIERAILELLLPLLQPIGDYRRDHVPGSKAGGRRKKEKKKQERKKNVHPTIPEPTRETAQIPDLYHHLTVGFNSTIRRLEALSQFSRPAILLNTAPPETPPTEGQPARLAAVFVSRQSLPDMMTTSLPVLVATSAPHPPGIRLIELSAQGEASMARALHQPRVGVLGLEEAAPDAAALVSFVRENLEAIDVPWLREAPRPFYSPVKVETSEAVIGSRDRDDKRKRKKPDGH